VTDVDPSLTWELVQTAMTDDRTLTRKKESDLLTSTGPDTDMGQLIRRYWQPVALSRELLPGAKPQAIRILGEDLVLFRTPEGQAGLLGRKCSHRSADLGYGRVENSGLRCLYHGWLFALDGKCLQQPTESAEAQAYNKVKQLSYVCHEAGGAIWAYFGPGETPLFPNYPPFTASDNHVFVHRWLTRCNFLQGNEGNLDPAHTSYLHGYVEEGEATPWADAFKGFQADIAPELFIQDTRFGIRIFAERARGEKDQKMLRVSNFIMPNAAAANGFETGFGRGGCAMVWHVPVDDTSHWRFEFTFHSKVSLEEGLGEIENIFNRELNEDGELKRRNKDGFNQDREEMESRSFSGMGPCFPIHDIFIVEGQGEIHDRSQEHLVRSDIAIVHARNQIREGIESIKKGLDPRGVIRDDSENRFNDLLVLTEILDEQVDSKEFCNLLEQQDIYQANSDS
jgi:phthalate 4,5-dioxygenase oxygenase subunit